MAEITQTLSTFFSFLFIKISLFLSYNQHPWVDHKNIFLSLRSGTFLRGRGRLQMVCGNQSHKTPQSRLGWTRQAVPRFREDEQIFWISIFLVKLKNKLSPDGRERGEMKQRIEDVSGPIRCRCLHCCVSSSQQRDETNLSPPMNLFPYPSSLLSKPTRHILCLWVGMAKGPSSDYGT